MKKATTAQIVTIVFVIIILAVIYFAFTRLSNKNTHVTLETNYGNIVLEIYADTPITSGNFEKLVGEGFYDGILFHRVVDGFMIQSGDPLTKDPEKKNLWGTGGSDTIKDEFNDKYSNVRGSIAMANAGPNTGSSQFFINLKDNVLLDGRHPVFGKVVEGMDVVDTIAKVAVEKNQFGEISRPIEEVKIIKASVK